MTPREHARKLNLGARQIPARECRLDRRRIGSPDPAHHNDIFRKCHFGALLRLQLQTVAAPLEKLDLIFRVARACARWRQLLKLRQLTHDPASMPRHVAVHQLLRARERRTDHDPQIAMHFESKRAPPRAMQNFKGQRTHLANRHRRYLRNGGFRGRIWRREKVQQQLQGIHHSINRAGGWITRDVRAKHPRPLAALGTQDLKTPRRTHEETGHRRGAG